jgi:hypothetical protein
VANRQVLTEHLQYFWNDEKKITRAMQSVPSFKSERTDKRGTHKSLADNGTFRPGWRNDPTD